MKAASKLALKGGSPIRKTWLPYSHQVIDESDIQAVTRALRGDLITRGPEVEGFEKAIAELVEMPYSVAFSSATAALHAVMSMYKVGPGVKVLTTPNTFAATANAVRYCNGEVVFKDVERETMNLDPKTLGDLSNIKVLTAVDFAGNPCRYSEFRELQKRHQFKLVDDASHSLGSSVQEKLLGAEADCTIFSFHPVKGITTGEGGMALVRDKEEANYLREFRSHGIRRNGVPGYYEQHFLGFNYNITDLQCALGLSQLKKLPRFIKRRQELAEMYRERLKAFSLFELPDETPSARSAWHLYPLRVRFKDLKISREDFLRALHAENIGANVHYIPVYWHPYYQELGYKKGLCPVAEDSYLNEVSIPLSSGMTDQDLEDVCMALEKLIASCS